MVNLKDLPRNATLEDAAKHLHVEIGDLDETFGVICVDPAEGVHTVLVEESALTKLPGEDSAHDKSYEGPFSNPVIQPFGPPVEEGES